MVIRIPASLWLAALLVATLIACSESPTTPPPPPPQCAYALSVQALSVPATGGVATVSVTTTASCAWTAQTTTAWLTVTAGATGTGSGVVTLTALANTSTTARTGTVTIAGTTIQVQQDGLPTCTYAISPTRAAVAAYGEHGTVSIATDPHCAWQSTAGASWVRIVSGASGTGPGTFSYSVDANPAASPRSTTLTIAGRPFVVEQSGDVTACTYQVAPVRFELCMVWTGDLVSHITTQEGCPWTAVSTAGWMSVVGGASGSGSGSVVLRGSDNWEPRRSGIVEVRWSAPTAGQNVVVDQAGCQYAVTRNSVNIAAAGGSADFEVYQQSDPITCGGPLQNACLWSAVANVPWITVTTSMPRTGDDRVTFVVAANPSSTPRSGTITVRDKVVTVTQAGQ